MKSCLAFLCLVCAAVVGSLPLDAGQMNVLVILADDLGQRDLGCYSGGEFYETPNLDRFASDAIRFTDGYAVSPVCSPTRYGLITGRWPARSQITNWLPGNRTERFRGADLASRMAEDEVTLAEVLKPLGYSTAFIGKWHLGETEDSWAEHQGFDVNVGGWSKGHPSSWFSPYNNPRLPDGPEGEFLTQRLADETIKKLREFKEDGKPFFLYHCFYQVHTPLAAPAELVKKYEAKAQRMGLQATWKEERQFLVSATSPRQVRQNHSHAIYAAMVESMDTATGRILATLDELGLAGNTLVIFTSDNGGLSTSEGGPTSNLPFRCGKGWIYEGGIREPFLVRWPGVTDGGAVSTAPVTTLDIYPTVLAALGVEAPAGRELDGDDIGPLLSGKTIAPRDLFWHYPHYSNQGGFPGGAIRSGDWKLIENYEDGSVSLYNLAEDVGEQHDMAAQEPGRVAELRGHLHAWYRETGAHFLQAKEGGETPWSPNETE